MFGIDSGELLIIAVVALVVIGPKDLPRAMRTIGNFVARARGMARHFRTGFDTMIREAELEEMEQKWKADNARIMRDHPLPPPAKPADSDWGKPGPDDGAVAEPGAAGPVTKPDPAPPAPPIPPAGAAPPIPSAGASAPAGRLGEGE